MTKKKKQFFIGSSRKYMLFADALKELFYEHDTIEAITWSDFFDEEGGGGYTYDNLIKAVSKFEFAVFFVTPDWKLESKNPDYAATPNVWFEAGMFMSRYGKENVLLIEEKSDERGNKIQLITDLKGLQPEIYTLENTTKSFLAPTNTIKPWEQLDDLYKENILSSLAKVKKKIEINIVDDTERVFDTITNIPNRRQCYEQGERIIQGALEYLYSIVSYEDEYKQDSKYPNGLFPYIENKLKELQLDASFTPEISKEFFKRWMNLGNDKIASQAEHILEKYKDYITIKDTFCNFIEVLISEQEVLILLPKPNNNKAVIGKGVLIKSKGIAREFLAWFEKLIPEPNNFIIDSKDQLYLYRQHTWNLQNRRMEGANYRCNACFGSVKNMPKEFQKVLEKEGLIKTK